MDSRQHSYEPTGENRLLSGMAFIAENPEAYGLVPDTCPVVTSDLLLAVNGHGATGGSLSPTYPVEEGGTEGILNTLYGDLLPHTAENISLLRATFGESEGMQEHPVARYCAALAEAVALHVLDGAAKGASPEQACFMVQEEISYKLSLLRDTIRSDGVTSTDDAFFSVSLGACRITPRGEGSYDVDVFAAGDFHVYLLDGEGLHPLWLRSTPCLSPDADETALICHRMVLHHPTPFALLLLSDSLCTEGVAETRALRDHPGMIWRYRMRLEDRLLRLITSCVREQEFGERATRFFTGRSHGRDSASGAMLIMREGVSYEEFRSLCQQRLSHLEDLISLLLEGFDPDRVPPRVPREEVEEAHLRRLLEKEKGMSTRVAEAVRLCALEKLEKGNAEEICPPPVGVPAYRRLSWEEVFATFRRYDVENDADRTRAEESRRVLRENLTDHWISLRPYLLMAAHREPTPAAHRSYASCADMQKQLGRMLADRQRRLNAIESLLTDSLAILRAEKQDWLEGRGGDSGMIAWNDRLEGALPPALTAVSDSWQAETEAYRSLLTAYTHERELLFRMDTRGADGFFGVDLQAIQNGELTDGRWEELCDTLADVPAYRDLLESLRRVSEGIGALMTRIHNRGAGRRMARELADNSDIRLAALRASAYEDEDWGESVIAVMDPAMRREHRDTVRRWQESCELAARRAEAYADYSASWQELLTPFAAGK